jgi:hypothetical protein
MMVKSSPPAGPNSGDFSKTSTFSVALYLRNGNRRDDLRHRLQVFWQGPLIQT